MRRKFFSNISLLILLNIMVKAFWVLGIDRTVQNRVGAGEYGFYFSLFSFSVLFNILLDFGITNYNNRKVAGDPGLLPGLLGNLFLIRVVFALAYMLVSITLAYFLGYNDSQRSLLYLLLVNQFIASFILYLRSNITALQLFRIDAFLSVADRFIMILVCSLLLWSGLFGNQFRIEWFVYSQTLAYAITFIIALLVVLRRSGIKRISFIPAEIPVIIKESAPFAILSLFMAIYWRVDTVMIERILSEGREAAGIYAQAFRLLDAASMIPYLFALILLPMFAKALSGGQSIEKLIRLAALLLLVPATIVSVVSAFYSVEIMELLYLEHTLSSAEVYRVLMLAYIPVSLVYIYSTILTAKGDLRTLNRVAGLGMVLNIALNFYMIPHYGARGSALASVVTQFLMSLLFYYYAVKSIPVSRGLSFIIKVLLNLAIVLFVAFVTDNQGLGLIPGISVIVAAGLISPLVTRLVTWSEIMDSIRGINE